jgi:hypothetical protein
MEQKCSCCHNNFVRSLDHSKEISLNESKDNEFVFTAIKSNDSEETKASELKKYYTTGTSQKNATTKKCKFENSCLLICYGIQIRIFQEIGKIILMKDTILK